MSRLTFAAAAIPAFLTATGAFGAVDFSGEFSLSGDSFSEPGLVVEADPMSGPVDFSLEEGESVEIELFDIWTDETWVNGDDEVPQDIEVAFAFSDPFASGSVGGETVGESYFHGVFQGGEVSWSEPLALSFGDQDDGLLEVSLNDAYFNWGVFGLHEGEHYGATISATVTLASAPSVVPLPAPGFLLLGALAGLGLAARSRRRAA